MTVYAKCNSCDDIHRIGERPTDTVSDVGQTWQTTVCPSCGDSSYVSDPQPDDRAEVERNRLRTSLDNIENVGETVKENIVERYGHVKDVCEAGVSGLTSVEYVGEQTAQNILDELTAIE